MQRLLQRFFQRVVVPSPLSRADLVLRRSVLRRVFSLVRAEGRAWERTVVFFQALTLTLHEAFPAFVQAQLLLDDGLDGGNPTVSFFFLRTPKRYGSTRFRRARRIQKSHGERVQGRIVVFGG